MDKWPNSIVVDGVEYTPLEPAQREWQRMFDRIADLERLNARIADNCSDHIQILRDYGFEWTQKDRNITITNSPVPRWVSVEDELPPAEEHVLFLGSSGAMHVGYHDPNSLWKWIGDDGGAVPIPAHWMPLPKAP